MADDRCDLLCLDFPRAELIRKNRLRPEAAQLFAGRAGGLADPTRLTLAAVLHDAGELCVCDLSWISERATNLVSHHLRALRAHGLVRSRRDGKLVIYALTEVGVDLVRAVLGVDSGGIRPEPHQADATP